MSQQDFVKFKKYIDGRYIKDKRALESVLNAMYRLGPLEVVDNEGTILLRKVEERLSTNSYCGHRNDLNVDDLEWMISRCRRFVDDESMYLMLPRKDQVSKEGKAIRRYLKESGYDVKPKEDVSHIDINKYNNMSYGQQRSKDGQDVLRGIDASNHHRIRYKTPDKKYLVRKEKERLANIQLRVKRVAEFNALGYIEQRNEVGGKLRKLIGSPRKGELVYKDISTINKNARKRVKLEMAKELTGLIKTFNGMTYEQQIGSKGKKLHTRIRTFGTSKTNEVTMIQKRPNKPYNPPKHASIHIPKKSKKRPSHTTYDDGLSLSLFRAIWWMIKAIPTILIVLTYPISNKIFKRPSFLADLEASRLLNFLVAIGWAASFYIYLDYIGFISSILLAIVTFSLSGMIVAFLVAVGYHED